MIPDEDFSFEAEAPQSVYEAQCYFNRLRKRVRAGESYGRGLKALLSRLGEWFDLYTFHPPERLEAPVPTSVSRSRFHALWGHIWEGVAYDQMDAEFEWLALWFEQANGSLGAASDNPSGGRPLFKS